MISRRRLLAVSAMGGAAWGATSFEPCEAAADGLAAPTGPVVLTISGKISATNADGKAVFDMHSLEALGLTSFKTKTPWEPETMFQGVLLETLMKTVQAHGTTVVASALNDYSAELPISDFSKYGTLLATRMNGHYMPVSDKGPLFIVYPFDSRPVLQSQTFYGRCVWQLNRLTII